MGNKLPKLDQWVKDLYDEKRETLWGKGNLEGIDYPAFWPPPQKEPTNINLQTLSFGKVYQFPVLEPSLLKNLALRIEKFPKIDIKKMNAPSSEMMILLSKIQKLSILWEKSIIDKDIYLIIVPFFDILDDHDNYKVIMTYLQENLYEQLNFFGLFDGRVTQNIIWFEKALPFQPDNFRYSSLLFILLTLCQCFESDNAPFLPWKKGTSGANSTEIPNLEEWKSQIPLYNATNGNFWTTMNGVLKDAKEVLDFWDRHPDVVKIVITFKRNMEMGNITFPNHDTVTDSPLFRESFLNIFKFQQKGRMIFRFPYWNFENVNKFIDVKLLNTMIRNYLYLMVYDVQLLIPNIWSMRQGAIERDVPFSDIRPVDPSSLKKNFDVYKTWWMQTSQWYFFDINRPLWPPGRQIIDEKKENDIVNQVFDFIFDHPPPALKVPPFNFAEWTRRSQGWMDVFEKQWDAYFEWVVENVKAQNSPNWVNPGDQLKNSDGELQWQDGDKKIPLLNTYPDYGIMSEEGGPFGRNLLFLAPFATPLDWIWGSDFWSFINGLPKKLFNLVLDVLKTLYKVVASVLPSALLIAGIGFAAYMVFSGKKPEEIYLQLTK